MAEDEQDTYYEYDPSLVASTIFIVLFGLSAAHHAFALIKHRTWYFIPFLVGVLCMYYFDSETAPRRAWATS
jgi:uncharacterized membrane protein YbhN (UPF0104 family)